MLSLTVLSASTLWGQTLPAPPAQASLSVHWEELSAAEFKDAITRAQGTCLLPFGILVYKSGFIPRILGIFLIIACSGYVTTSVTTLISPHYGRMLSGWMMLPAGLGELSIVFWLLVKGVRTQPPAAPARL